MKQGNGVTKGGPLIKCATKEEAEQKSHELCEKAKLLVEEVKKDGALQIIIQGGACTDTSMCSFNLGSVTPKNHVMLLLNQVESLSPLEMQVFTAGIAELAKQGKI